MTFAPWFPKPTVPRLHREPGEDPGIWRAVRNLAPREHAARWGHEVIGLVRGGPPGPGGWLDVLCSCGGVFELTIAAVVREQMEERRASDRRLLVEGSR